MTEVLRDVSFSVAEKAVVALLGGNGSGKTTILNALSGHGGAARGSIRSSAVRSSGLRSEQVVRAGLIQVPAGARGIPLHDGAREP